MSLVLRVLWSTVAAFSCQARSPSFVSHTYSPCTLRARSHPPLRHGRISLWHSPHVRLCGIPPGQGRRDGVGDKRLRRRKRGAARSSVAPVIRVAEPDIEVETADEEELLRLISFHEKQGMPRKAYMTHQKLIEPTPTVSARIMRCLVRLKRLDLAQDMHAHSMEAGRAVQMTEASVVLGKGLSRAGDFDGCKSLMKMLQPAEQAQILYTMVSNLLMQGQGPRAMAVMRLHQAAWPSLSIQQFNEMIKQFGKNKFIEGCFLCLRAMHKVEVPANDDTCHFIANAAVRSVEFKRGVVDMEGLPKDGVHGEAAFIGRSNVGKSSLINMVCARKALAYTSKTPGKTQEFNFFLINGDSQVAAPFYLVDLPGVGYARVPMAKRVAWQELFMEYLQHRKHLKVVFHLVDSRVGRTEEDLKLMQLLAATPRGQNGDGSYVIVLTKMDKKKAGSSMIKKIQETLVECGCNPATPIVLTSAKSRQGRDAMWRYLEPVAVPKE